MLELIFVVCVSASAPALPPPPKEVAIERLVGLPAKELEFAPFAQRAEQEKDDAEPPSRVREKRFGNLRQFNRRGNRNH